MSAYLDRAHRASVTRASIGVALVITLMALSDVAIGWFGYLFVTGNDHLAVRIFAVLIPIIFLFATILVSYFLIGKVRERIAEGERASLRAMPRRSTYVEAPEDRDQK